MQTKLNGALGEALRSATVVPVLTIDDPATGVEIARALQKGGLNLIEITLRTPAAAEVIRRISKEVREVNVGAGTVLDPDDAAQAIAAGARFIVSPGMTPRLIEAAETWEIPYLPGAATASEAMALADLGYRVLSSSRPCRQAAQPIKALAAPLPGVTFCPTGGIDAGNAADFLALPNVAAVGGSWVAPAKEVGAKDWLAVSALAHQAATLRVKT